MKTARRSLMAILIATTTGASAYAAGAKASKEADLKAQHVVALDKAIAGDNKGALAILNKIAEAGLSPDERDRVYLSMGRVRYQAGDDQGALDAYEKVRNGSLTWLEALEERSWTLMRMDKPDAALALLKTVLSPLFKDRVRSEPFFLAGLAQLRVCDYPGVFKTLDLFKTRFRPRVQQWEALGGPVEKVKLTEAAETIQKLNLVEAEAIQKLFIDESGKRMKGRVPVIARSSDELSFPSDSDIDEKEVWLDEVEDFRVNLKGCPQPTASTSDSKGSRVAGVKE